MASGQAVRRLTLDQETEGSNPSSPAKPQHPSSGLIGSAPADLVAPGTRARLSEQAPRCEGIGGRMRVLHLEDEATRKKAEVAATNEALLKL